MQNSDDSPSHGRIDVVKDEKGNVVAKNVVNANAAFTVYDLDFAVNVGTILVAPASGKFVHASGGGYGWYGKVIMPDGNWVMIAHLSGYIAADGQDVTVGQPVAYSGGKKGSPGAGTTTGPHVHYSVRKGDGSGVSQPMEVWAYETNTGRLQFFRTGKQGSGRRDFTCFHQQPENTSSGYFYESRMIGGGFGDFMCRQLNGANGLLCWHGNPTSCEDGLDHVRYFKNAQGASQSESDGNTWEWCVKDTGKVASAFEFLKGGYGVGGGGGDDSSDPTDPTDPSLGESPLNLEVDFDVMSLAGSELVAGQHALVKGSFVDLRAKVGADGADLSDWMVKGKDSIEVDYFAKIGNRFFVFSNVFGID